MKYKLSGEIKAVIITAILMVVVGMIAGNDASFVVGMIILTIMLSTIEILEAINKLRN